MIFSSRGVSASAPVLALFVLLSVLGTSRSECLQYRPYMPVCSGHGQCINDTCVCDPGWTSRNYFINRGHPAPSDCDTNEMAMNVILGLSLATSGPSIIWACWRLITYGRYPLWSEDTSHRRMQRICMTILIGGSTAFSVSATSLLGNEWTDTLWASVFFQMIFYATFFLYYVLRARNVIPLACYLLKSEHPNLRVTGNRVMAVHIALNAIGFLGVCVALNGIYAYPTNDGKETFLWIFFGIQYVHQLLSGILLAAFYIILGRLLAEQLERMKALSGKDSDVGSSQRRSNIQSAHEMVVAMTRANMTMLIFTFLLLSAVFIYPPISTYYTPLLVNLASVVAITGFLRFPPPERNIPFSSTATRSARSNNTSDSLL